MSILLILLIIAIKEVMDESRLGKLGSRNGMKCARSKGMDRQVMVGLC